jgi:hypothetical protein
MMRNVRTVVFMQVSSQKRGGGVENKKNCAFAAVAGKDCHARAEDEAG